MKRVVVTGMGAVSPFGLGKDILEQALLEGQSGISILEELREIAGLTPRIAGKVPPFDSRSIPRKFRRTMSPMSIFATLAAQEALDQAGLNETELQAPTTGLVVGSTLGSAWSLQSFFAAYLDGLTLEGTKSTEFFKIMNHSCAANLAQLFQIRGRVMAPSAACSTGCQSIGLAYECVACGRQDIMLCGGADELHPLTVGTFDILEAASSHYNDSPDQSPRPFDARRDGIVCSEGAGILVLESLKSAQQRGVSILAEITGFSSTSDPSNMASPSPEAIADCMRQALGTAGLSPDRLDYINAHATGTTLGDAAECLAIASCCGNGPLVSSLKGHLGHTMAASGAIETVATILMMQHAVAVPTRNLLDVAPDCSGVNHLQTIKKTAIRTALKNSFALGGINTSLVLEEVHDRPGNN